MTTRLRTTLLIAATIVAASAVARWAFPRAFPLIALENQLTVATAKVRADSFFTAHDLAPTQTRRAVQFHSDDSTITYVDLAAGGADTLNAIARAGDPTLFIWSVRAFEPGEVREARVDFAPDGRVIGFRRKLSNSDTLPDIGADSATVLARHIAATWLGADSAKLRVATTGFETRRESGRVDRTVTFERTDRKVGEAPIRLDVTIAGNTPAGARPYVYVPEAFLRRYGEMRSANDLLAIIANVGMLVLVIAGALTLRKYSRAGLLRWRAPLIVGGVIGALLAAAAFNALDLAWFSYDTATPPSLYQVIIALGAVAGGVTAGGLTALTLVAAEAATRIAFPRQADWWQLWRTRGTDAVAGQVFGGYAVGALALAYVTTFYLFTRGTLGWWVPTSIMDDPNQIATPAPWLTGLAISLNAGVWEEAMFRALPLSLLAIWAKDKPNYKWWMVGGVVATSLVFGFAHANYPSWPPYSRGVELFIDSAFWAILFLRFGLLVTVVGHFAYDQVLFSLFAATGTAPEYRITLAIALLALAAPALAVAWRLIRQRTFSALGDDARFGAWVKPEAASAEPLAAPPPQQSVLTAHARQFAIAAIVAGVVVAVARPARPTLGPQFTADRARALAVADSMLQARGVSPDGWRRLSTTASDTLPSLRRYLREHKLDSLAPVLAESYVPPAWWVVRYVHTEGDVSARAEEWRARVYPDGRPLDVRRIVPDSAPGDALEPDAARRIARAALAGAGIDTLRLREADYEATERPRRRDVTITWIDTTLALGEGASARVWVSLAGSEVLVVRRGIELPEAFQRSVRERQTRNVAFMGIFLALAFGAVVAGTIFAIRRRPELVTDRMFDRRTGLAIFALLAASAVASSLSGWPSTVFSYDTASAWSNHIGMSVIGVLVVSVLALLLVGLWLVVESLRRRVGMPAWPAPDTARDALLAGVSLGAVFALSESLRTWVAPSGTGAAPSTTLDAAFPVLAGLPDVVMGVAGPAMVAAIPLLALMALWSRERDRWIVLAAFVAIGAALVGPVTVGERPAPPTLAEGVVAAFTLVASVWAIRTWGRWGPVAWLAAAAAMTGIGQLRSLLRDPTTVEQLASGLTLVATLAVIWWLWRRATSPRLPAT